MTANRKLPCDRFSDLNFSFLLSQFLLLFLPPFRPIRFQLFSFSAFQLFPVAPLIKTPIKSIKSVPAPFFGCKNLTINILHIKKAGKFYGLSIKFYGGWVGGGQRPIRFQLSAFPISAFAPPRLKPTRICADVPMDE